MKCEICEKNKPRIEINNEGVCVDCVRQFDPEYIIEDVSLQSIKQTLNQSINNNGINKTKRI